MEAVQIKHQELESEHIKLNQLQIETASELETLNFSYNEMELDLHKGREELGSLRKQLDQLKMELLLANQTIEEQHKAITKYSKELQVHQEREYFLTQKYND